MKLSTCVGAEMFVITRNKEQCEMLDNGYKEDFSHNIFEPDTVWAGPRSKVYHSHDYCVDGGCADWTPMPESEAVRRGLRRCKRCDWGVSSVPNAGTTPRAALPVSTCLVRPSNSYEKVNQTKSPKKAKKTEAELAQKRREKAKSTPRQPTDAAGVKKQAKIADSAFIAISAIVAVIFRNIVVSFLAVLFAAFFAWDFWKSFNKTDEVIAKNIASNKKLDIEAELLPHSDK